VRDVQDGPWVGRRVVDGVSEPLRRLRVPAKEKKVVLSIRYYCTSSAVEFVSLAFVCLYISLLDIGFSFT
jgi:hypothetical protein